MTHQSRFPASFWAASLASGVLGSVGMALYIMSATALTGRGFWTPMNMIAAVVPSFRPPAMAFVAGPTLSGIAIHLTMGAAWGLAFGSLAALILPTRITTPIVLAMIAGLGLGVAVYLVTGVVIGPTLDPVLSKANPLHYFVAHVVFGLVTAGVLATWTGRRALSVTFAPDEAARSAPRTR